jgi:hypothetical protein
MTDSETQLLMRTKTAGNEGEGEKVRVFSAGSTERGGRTPETGFPV